MLSVSSDDLFRQNVLLGAGFHCQNNKRLSVVARVVASNKFRRLDNLRRATHVDRWLYKDRLRGDEAAQLEALCSWLAASLNDLD